MPTTLPWGEQVTVLMELGFAVSKFTLDSATLGVLDGDGVLDGTLEGDDVSGYIRSLSINRGRSDQLQNFSAGTATIELVNNDRRFDPINSSSPYWDTTTSKSGVTPRRKVTIKSGSDIIFVGRITDIDIQYEYNLSFVTISAADDFVLLASAVTTEARTPSVEASGSRVSYFLDLPEIAYPATRSISAGIASLGAYPIEANTNALAYLQQIATAEQGFCFISGNGTLTFTDRAAAAFASIQAYFADDGTNIPYKALSVIYGQELLYNKVSVTNSGSTPQVANDTASQTEYGVSTLALDGLLLETDAAAASLASTLVARYAYPEYRFDLLQVQMEKLTEPQRVTIAGLEIGEQVSIKRTYSTGTPSSVTLVFNIERISHNITPSGHLVEFSLAVVELVYPFLLDDAIYGVLDSANALT